MWQPIPVPGTSDEVQVKARYLGLAIGLVAVAVVCLFLSPEKRDRPSTIPLEKGPNGLEKLDDWVSVEPQYASLASSMRTLYGAIRDKKADVLYALRPDDFQKAVSFELYSNTVSQVWHRWSLDDYSVLGIRVFDKDRVRFVVRTRESGISNFDVAVWRKEESGWKCVDLGLSELPLSRSMREAESN